MLFRSMLGLTVSESWEVVRRAGIDSVPKLRGAIIRHLAGAGSPQTTTDVASAVDHPTRSALRTLEDLTAHGVVTRVTAGQGYAHKWELSGRARGWHDAAETSPEMADGQTETTTDTRTSAPFAPSSSPQADDLFSGADDDPHCGRCGAPVSPLRYAQAGPLCGRCEAAP